MDTYDNVGGSPIYLKAPDCSPAQLVPLEQFTSITLRASSFGVISAKRWCVHCANLTRVAGIILPAKHEAFVQRGAVDRQWIVQSNRLVLTNIEVLQGAVLERVRQFAPKYEIINDEIWGSVYQNHCEHCGAKHDDREIYRDVEGALDYRQIGSTAVSQVWFDEPFLGSSADGIDADQRETNPDVIIADLRRASRAPCGQGRHE